MSRFTTKAILALKSPGHHVDGEGLALVIGKRGGKSWVLRTMVRGKRRDIGLGGVSWVSLAEAREKARAVRKIAREGGDPMLARKLLVACPTFKEAATQVHAEQIVGQAKNDKHRAQWLNTLRDYVFPLIGSIPVRDVSQADVLRVLAPIWTEKAETARRVRQRIRTVIDWARTAGHFEGVNPVEGVEKGLAKQRDKVTHHAAMAWTEVPAFLPSIGEGVAAQALRFLVLTAARTGEVIGARWAEVKWDEKLWVIPADRMKAGREHKVPLTEEALSVVESMRGQSANFIFPGNKANSGISNMAMTQLLRRLGRGDVTVHGFRSSFRDWAAEKSNMPREIAELCLAHEVGNEVERAYRRSELLEKRYALMAKWSMFCCRVPATVHLMRKVYE